MLPAGCSRRLLAELQDALDACAERQWQLERSLRVSRQLLRTWEPAEAPAAEPAPGPETNEEAPPPACTPNPQDLKELELLTQALEKAVRVRKGISKAGERHKALSLKSGSTATSASTASAPSRASGQAGRRASETKPPRGSHQTTVPARGLPECRLPSVGDHTAMGRGSRATKPGPGLRDQQIPPSAAPQAPEAFTLKEKGTLLKLPMAYRKAASQNSRLWAQLSSTRTSDCGDAATTAKTQFLQKMKMTSGSPGSGLSAAQVEAEVGLLRKACSLLRQRMEEELSAGERALVCVSGQGGLRDWRTWPALPHFRVEPADWMQEYHCLLTLEGLQALTGQCIHRMQELRAVAGQQLGPWPEGRCPSASMPHGGSTDPAWSPQLLLYSSTKELQTLAALRLRVAMLDQQIHLEKVLMAELLPLVSKQDPQGPPWLALCRAVHSLLCEGGERFLTILRDEPAD
ncbi:tubulin epsilon and delta complex protein 2 isoform X2 [Ailuropoda melanoleuca]|uniref:tubulin epsilon and delta complex protein 2 isoform X2 n=1 Tax=Ailuropoda melanoleuca TaxID=9646 RepID=UPI001493ECFB|nr:tubulin epsilon and delta complex protein 2 isoform X2 [Ailuropoda melanoleuca]